MIPKKLVDEINTWIDMKKYGNIQINFKAGRIFHINRIESVKIESASEDLDLIDKV
jgi:hypothetical protein